MFLYQQLKYNYKHIDITDKRNATVEIANFLKNAVGVADYVCYDTETDGLSIITSKPFLVSMGYYDKKNKKGNVVTFDYDAEIMKIVWNYYQVLDFKGNNKDFIALFAHNAKYDYHMMINGGSPIPEEQVIERNGKSVKVDSIEIMDSITVARLTEYADDRESMSLENLGGKYVDDNSKFAGKIIKDIVKSINAERRTKLRNEIMDAFPDDGFYTVTKKDTRKGTSKLTNLIDDYKRSRTQFVNDDDKYFKFIDEHFTEANYKDAYEREPELVRSYAADDIVIMIEYLNKAIPTLYNVDEGLKVMKREGLLIRAVADMERVGLRVDVDYVLQCRKNIVDYRDLLYFELQLYTGLEFGVGQHDFIKKFLKNKYAIKTDKADEKALKYIREHSDNQEVKDICSNILELRTIDKWLSTYVDGKLNSVINGRIYTDINNNGAVSGRVSCDMQQQPKEGLYDRDGNELFHPRRMFVVDEDYLFAFCDESQMELRVQAYYTILHGKEPDLAMCRAYMPYKCVRIVDDGSIGCGQHQYHFEKFDFTKVDDLKYFSAYKWYLEEDTSIEWTPTDLHSETTRHAFPELDTSSDEFKKKRKLGKRANFLKVYQGGVQALQESLEIPRDVAEALDKAFYAAFPRIRDYQDWVTEHLTEYGYVENLYGRRYYMNDSKWFYKGCNYLIQGTCADMVKLFEIRVWKYIRENNLKSKMVLPIHDEIMLLVHKDEMFVIEEVKRIMEDVTDVIKYIPMISEPEISSTNWAEKKEYVI